MSDSQEWVTIAEAAQQIGIPERTLRHAITRHGYAAQTRQEARQTRTGTRQTTLIPAALVPPLAHHFEEWKNPALDGNSNAAKARQNTANMARETPQASAALVAYEMALREKDARIADLQAALSHERARAAKMEAMLETEQQNVARAQALNALTAPPQEAVATREAGGDGETPVETEKDTAGGAGRPWWAWWRKGKV